MSHVVIQCSGCLSKLRFKAKTGRENIDCPRCGESLDVTAAVSNQSRTSQRSSAVGGGRRARTARPVTSSARRSNSEPGDHEFVDDILDDDLADEDEIRAKKESVIFLGIVAVAVLAALIAVPSGIIYLLNGDVDDETIIADSSVSKDVNNSAHASEVPTSPALRDDSSTPPTTPADNSTSSTNANAAARAPDERSQEKPLTPSEHGANPVDRSDSGQATDVAKVPDRPTPEKPESLPAVPAPVVPKGQPKTAVNPPPAVAANGDDEDGLLMYRWAAGQEHVYQLKITADHGGGTKQNISGTCTYTVHSDGHEHADVRESSGTGFVVAANGIIATCAHVVEGAKTIEVTLGGRTYPGKVIVEKGKLDLALVKIDANGLPVSVFGDSDKVQLAEPVRAFGFPLSTVLGTGIKVATGAVAGIVMHPQHGKQIQTDAPINPGNSGGPILNESGQVIGVASSKIASSAASSVGFAVPINELKTIMSQQGFSPPTVADLPNLPGPELAKNVTPTVAFIKVSGTSGGEVFDIGFSANFTESQSINPRNFRLGGFPMFPSSNHDRGTMKVNRSGEIVEFTGKESLPYVLGPIGQFFIEPLDPYGDSQWTDERLTQLRIVKREANDPLSQMRSRMSSLPFGPRGRFGGGFNPFGDAPKEETLKTFPATERTSYSIGPKLNDRITIHKKYEFTTTKNPQRPYLAVRGSGDIVFDRTSGMPSTYEFNATITQNDDDGTVTKLPITVSYSLRDPEVVKKERADALAQAEERRKQQELEQTTPNPDLVDELLQKIRAAEGSFAGNVHLQKLAKIAIVPEKREAVLDVARNHRKNSNGFIQASAAEILCKWCTADGIDEMWEIAFSDNHLLNNAKKTAVARLMEFDKPDLYAKLIKLMKNISMRHDLKGKLIAAGAVVEPHVLKEFASVDDRSVKRDLVEVLQKVGTKESLPLLESLVSDGDASLKYAAQRALDSIRGRQ